MNAEEKLRQAHHAIASSLLMELRMIGSQAIFIVQDKDEEGEVRGFALMTVDPVALVALAEWVESLKQGDNTIDEREHRHG